MKQYTDPDHLKREQYRDSSKLDARIALHRRFGTNPEDFHRWYFDRLHVPEYAAILEIGAGSAAFWVSNADRIPEGWRVTLTDLSPGMLDSAREALHGVDHPFAYREADIQNLPFGDESFDAVIANHMLYHVPDRQRGIAEVRRVLRRDGRLYAATNGPGHLLEIRQRMQDAGADVPLAGGGAGFGLDNGAEQLRLSFDHVVVVPFLSSLRVTEAEPLKAFFWSMADIYGLDQEHLTSIERRVEEDIRRDGVITIQTSTGFFECW